MQTFREWMNESNKYFEQNENLEKLLAKKFPDNFNCISAIGNGGIDVIFTYENKKEASKSSNIDNITKTISTIIPVKINRNSKSYKNGTEIQETDWRKDSPEDKHDLYISFI